MLGILFLDKPPGITSHDVVNRVRRALGTRRVGHAGSLDPMATGLLVVAVGPATRFLQYLSLEPKFYACEATFGVETTTQDADGEIVARRPVPDDLPARVADALPRLHGLVEQIPPMYSAVKRDGKPLYAYARKGETVEVEPRSVFVERFATISWQDERAQFEIECSGGTYIRTLVHDLGAMIGCGAHVSSLRRTGAGAFRVDSAGGLDDLVPSGLVPLREALRPLPMVELTDSEVKFVRDGQSVPNPQANSARLVGLVEPSGECFSVARLQEGRLHPECVIPAEAFRAV